MKSLLLLLVLLCSCTDPEVASREAAVLIADDLEVDGSVVVGSELTVHGTTSLIGTVVTADRVVVGADLVVGGDVLREALHLVSIPGSMASDPNGLHTPLLSKSGAHVGWRISDRSPITYPVPAVVGDHVRGWRLYLHKSTGVLSTIVARMYRVDNTGDEQPLGAGAATAAGTGDIAIGEAGIDLRVETGWQYYVIVTGGGAPGDLSYHAEIDANRIPN